MDCLCFKKSKPKPKLKRSETKTEIQEKGAEILKFNSNVKFDDNISNNQPSHFRSINNNELKDMGILQSPSVSKKKRITYKECKLNKDSQK